MNANETSPAKNPAQKPKVDHLRFHRKHQKLLPTFGENWFALKAEAFARFFGTPLFLGAQTIIVVVWIAVNEFGWAKFDIYPFILLNLAFSLQAAYAAPLILLAQTRQAERDKANAEADALHREELAHLNDQRLEIAAQQNEQMLKLLEHESDQTAHRKSGAPDYRAS
jgi:uncharacterized membrane protein